MSFLDRLLHLFGLKQEESPHTYNLNSDLQVHIAELAQQEQRSPEEITEQLVSQALHQRQFESDLWQRWNSLSPREQQVAALACQGYANGEIANQIGVSINTVKSHITNILSKFSVSNRRELALLLSAWDFSGWVPPRYGDDKG